MRMQTVSRLLTQFIPKTYNIALTIDTKKEQFSGKIDIIGTAKNKTIVLHAKELKLDQVLVNGKPCTVTFGQDDEVTISHDTLQPGEHIIHIEYHAPITEFTRGIYASRYKQNGKNKAMYVTQNEPDYAREIFPCIDEPAAKAVFNISIITAESLTVLGNMPIAHQSHKNGLQTVHFQPTPRMSTYLFALAIGELHSVQAKTKRGIDVGVWATTVQKKEHLTFALENAVQAIDFYEEFFGVEYPLPKSDQLALPDVTSGVAAMENWGLVTYREDSLVMDPGLTSIASKRRTAIVIAHELSHQWFGNLVTMDWWTYLWLNESFATVMEYICVDALHPEWNVWQDFAAYENVVSLRRDSLDGVQSVEVPVHHPDEIGSLFDGAIVYAKGSRLVRMVQAYCGVPAFRTALKQYFTDHTYANTTGADLWQALSAASGKNVLGFMESWVSQPGYPVVSATLKNGNLTLTQQQFFVGPHKNAKRLWPIPLDASLGGLPELFDSKTVTVPFTAAETLRLNVHDTAHFITRYDDDLFGRLLTEVANGNMEPIARMQLLHEQTLLARGSMISSARLIDLLAVFKDETHEGVWNMITLAFGELKKFVEQDNAAERALKQLAGQTAEPLYKKLGLTAKSSEDEETTKLRANIVGLMAYSEDPHSLQQMIDLYGTAGVGGIDPEIRSIIMSVAVRHGSDSSLVDTLLDLYDTTPSAEIQGDIADAVTSTKNPARITELIGLLTNTKKIRTQDTVHWFIDLMRNRYAREQTWEWCKHEWPWIMATFGDEMNADAFLRYGASTITTRALMDDFIAFTTPLKNELQLARTISLGVNDIQGRIELIEKDGPAVLKALKKL